MPGMTFGRFAALAAATALLAAPAAHAFLPSGGFDSFDTLRFRTFPLAEFDANGNGQVEPNEGLEFFVEGGPRGFTTQEIDQLLDAMQVWEEVPTSYASFRPIRVTEDIVDLTSLFPDRISSITLQVGPDDIIQEGQEPDAVDDVTEGLVGITITTYTLDDTLIENRGQQEIIPAGTILDSDIIINANVHRRTAARPDVIELEATAAILLGLHLGLSFTPLNNLREVNITGGDVFDGLVESEVMGLSRLGVQRRIGVTPTMFPAYFQTDDFETGTFRGGWADLAPDDISAISWLYPRDSQAGFFTISQEARSNARAGSNLPSTPISGGHIVAWGDVDNDPSTPRVPVFNTLSGLYVNPKDEALWGRFQLIGLWKQMEIPGTNGVFFNPSYTLSLNALNGTGLARQAPGEGFIGSTADFFDSISGTATGLTVIGGAGGTKDYDTNFVSEVFQEIENVTDVSNKDAGTPLIWDFARNTVVSADTGKTLAQMLPLDRPMFGDANDVCPLNVISGAGTGTDDGGTPALPVGRISASGGPGGDGGLGGSIGLSSALRRFRDNVLLNSAPGMLLVNTYYTAAPYAARFLLATTEAIPVARTVIETAWWVAAHAKAIAALLALALVGGWLWRRRRAAAASLLLIAALGLALPAESQIIYRTNQQMVDEADLVVRGVILTENARWSGGGRIYTDHTLSITDIVKAPQPRPEGEDPIPAVTEGGTLAFTVLGGQIDTVIMVAKPIPTFDVDDEVILYFVYKNDKWIVLNGERGKAEVLTKDGHKVVVGGSITSGIALNEAAKEIPGAVEADEAGEHGAEIPVEDYLAYLRSLAEGSAE